MPGYLYTKEECGEKKKTQIDMEVSECLSGISENASIMRRFFMIMSIL